MPEPGSITLVARPLAVTAASAAGAATSECGMVLLSDQFLNVIIGPIRPPCSDVGRVDSP